jgi:hypothetical protein
VWSRLQLRPDVPGGPNRLNRAAFMSCSCLDPRSIVLEALIVDLMPAQ